MTTGGFDGFDRIVLTGVKAFGHHGVLAAERRDGQWFIVDATLHVETREAAATDDLTKTVDYARAAQVISDSITGDPLNLIEALAQRVAERLLELRGIFVVDVTVHKPGAPIPLDFADVSVSISRMR